MAVRRRTVFERPDRKHVRTSLYGRHVSGLESVGRAIAYLLGGGRFVDAYDSLSEARDANNLLSAYRQCMDDLKAAAHEYRALADKEAAELLAAEVLGSISPVDAKAAVFGSHRGEPSLDDRLLSQPWVQGRLRDLGSEAGAYARSIIRESSRLYACRRGFVLDDATVALLESDAVMHHRLDELLAFGPQVTERIRAIPTRMLPIEISGVGVITVPVSGTTTVAQFLDLVWFHIRGRVPPYSYGRDWCLTIVDKGDHFVVLESDDARELRDARLLLPSIDDTIGLDLEFRSSNDV